MAHRCINKAKVLKNSRACGDASVWKDDQDSYEKEEKRQWKSDPKREPRMAGATQCSELTPCVDGEDGNNRGSKGRNNNGSVELMECEGKITAERCRHGVEECEKGGEHPVHCLAFVHRVRVAAPNIYSAASGNVLRLAFKFTS